MNLRATAGVIAAALLVGCASLPPGADYPKTVSTAVAPSGATTLGRQVEGAARAHPGLSGFRLLTAGLDGFLTRAQMANAAQGTLDLQYFILRGDDSGTLLADALVRAADRGVRVRVLIDDGETEEGDAEINALNGHTNIEVRIFNPFVYRGHAKLFRAAEFMFSASRLDYRMHNKLFVADNAVALIGGRNIADAYFQVDPESQFADDDVFAAGPLVAELSATFDEYWNSAIAIPVQALGEGDAARQPSGRERSAQARGSGVKDAPPFDGASRIASGEPLAGMLNGRLPLVWAHAQVVCDSPEKKKVEADWLVGRLMHRPVAKAVAAVQSELLMITPYLIPGAEGMKIFEDLRRRNVRVRVLTNSMESSTVALAQAGYMGYRVPLLQEGIELYEVRSLLGNSHGSGQSAAMSRFGNYSLHAKLFVLDRQRLFVGSMNFDQRSMHLNTEIGLIIDSPELAQQMAARFEAMVQPLNAYQVRLRSGDQTRAPALTWTTREGTELVEYKTEPARSGLQRFGIRMLTWVPADKEL